MMTKTHRRWRCFLRCLLTAPECASAGCKNAPCLLGGSCPGEPLNLLDPVECLRDTNAVADVGGALNGLGALFADGGGGGEFGVCGNVLSVGCDGCDGNGH